MWDYFEGISPVISNYVECTLQTELVHVSEQHLTPATVATNLNSQLSDFFESYSVLKIKECTSLTYVIESALINLISDCLF